MQKNDIDSDKTRQDLNSTKTMMINMTIINKSGQLIPIACLALSSIFLSSCGIKVYTDADNESIEIKIDNKISSIETSATTDIEYYDTEISNEQPSIKLIGPKDRLKEIKIQINNGHLTITRKNNKSISGRDHTKLIVKYPGISSFITSGTGDIGIQSSNSQNIYINSLGTGDINCNRLKGVELKCETMGTGDIDIKSVDFSNVMLLTSGTGDINISNLKAITVTASTQGTGDITLSGTCTNTNFDIQGSGKIINNNLSVDK